MKRIMIVLVMFQICIAMFGQATDLVITTEKAGQLSKLISEADQKTVKNLKVIGKINDSDLSFIGKLICMKLRGTIDLSEAIIKQIDGQNPFILSVPSDGVSPIVDKLVLPKSLEQIINAEENYYWSFAYVRFNTLVIDTKIETIDKSLRAGVAKHFVFGENVDSIKNFIFSGSEWPSESIEIKSYPKYIDRFIWDGANSVVLSKNNVEHFANVEHIGFQSFGGATDERAVYYNNKGVLSEIDTLKFPNIRTFHFNSFTYRSGIHVFLGPNLQEANYQKAGNGVKYYSLDGVTFHIAAKIPPKTDNLYMPGSGWMGDFRFMVPKESVSEYIEQGWPNVYPEPVPLTSIELKPNDVMMEIGKSRQILAIPVPENADNQKFLWSSNNENIARVDAEGNVTAIRAGETIITVTSEGNPKIKASCKVVVIQHVTGITLSDSTYILKGIGQSVELNATIQPADATNKNVTWKSFNDAVCVVVNGKVIATGYGTTVVLATTEDGGFSASCTVTVAQPTYTLNIKATGNGSATYNGTNVRGGSRDFVVNTGTSATIIFSPDDGYRISSVKLNNTDVTASVANSRYTINNITANTTLAVTFEAIPPTTYAFTISAVGNGTVSYDGKTVRSKTSSFTVVEGTNVVVKFSADEGYRLKSVKLDNTDVTSSVKNNQYIISNIKANTSLEVIFEAIPTYALNITASGNGSVTYNNIAVRGKTQTFTASEGTSATIKFTPDAGYKIKSVKLNTTDVTASVANNQYTISNIKSDNTLEVEFEAITHTLTIKAIGNGSATFNSIVVKGKSQTFTVNEGTSATIAFTPDAGYRIKSVKLNSIDVTANVISNQYTISNIKSDNTLEVEFEAITHTLTIKAIGNGSATFNSIVVKGKSQSFTVNEGTSAIITFTPDAGYRIKSVKLNATDVTASVANNQYTISNIKSDNTLEVEFEAIIHTLNIVAVGNGNVDYNGIVIRNQSQSYSVQEGSSVVLSFAPDAGYRVGSVKVNNTDVTASVTNNSYTISNITANTTLAVMFEAIPPTTYAFTISAVGNGTVTYDGNAVRGKTSSFTIVEGTNAVVTFSADDGYRLKSVKLYNTDVTSSVVNNQYTIRNIKANTSLEVTFEAIPTYSLNITASDNGSVTYNGTAVRGKTQTFTVKEGTSATITFAPDAGYRIASVKLNNADVTASVANSQYTISNITANTTLAVMFEAIPPTTYAFTISAVGNGTVTYDGNTVRGKTSSFTVVEGTNVIVTFSADEGYRLKSVKLGNTDVTSSVVNNQYTIRNIKANTSLEVTFEAIPTYSLNITASGNGSVTYNGTAIRGKTQTFTVKEGTSATVTFTPDAGYRIASVKLNNTDVTASVANSSYTISNITANTTLSVTFEAIPPTTYAFTISAVGNGTVTYDGNAVRGKTSSFTVVEGTNAVVTFSADEGYRLKSMKLNNTDVTSSVVNNQYTISNIKANTSLEVTFEAIPTYALNIVATGNGSASYNGVTIRNQSQNFTLREGVSAVVSFSADNGYRIGSVKLNNVDVTSQIVDGKITISSITQNTNVEVVFEEIPPTVYALSITATGNGSVTYDGKTIKGKTSSFTIIEGSYVTVQLSADDGYRLKSITLNGQDVTADVVNNQYTTPKIMADAALVVVFEAIPTFTLTIKSSAFGSVKYGDVVVTNRTETFSVREGTSATMTFTPDDNGRLRSIILNGNDITNQLVNGQYTISNIRANQSIEAEFVEDITKVTDAGVAYTVTSYDDQTVVVAAGNYGNVLTVPASFTAKEKTWTVVGIDEDALKDNTALAAIIWNPEVAFTAKVSNPNLLLYVKASQYAPATVQNVVVGDDDEGEVLMAENIVLVEAASGNDFYCPQAFTAKRISYEHNYSMISGYKTCQGWETLVLPFDVTMMINAKGQELTPYSNWQYGNSQRPFWLYEMTAQGWKAGSAIKANTPYIISMPNNEMYDVSFNQTGNIQFIGTNVEVKASTEMKTGQHGNKRLVANYQTQEASADIYALNVSNEWSQNTATEAEGSTFIRSLRSVHPFEAYLTVEGSNAPWAIPIFENLPTGINEKLIVNSEKFATATDWYTIDGRKLQGEPKKAGIYIYKGEKVRR